MKDPKNTFLNVVRETMTKEQKGAAPNSELGRYSGTNYTSTMSPDDIDSFDILAWWKGREAKFMVLSTMARDLLSSKVSTVGSESAFSTCGMVISLRRTRLSPEAVEHAFVEDGPSSGISDEELKEDAKRRGKNEEN
ncbi:hypothetical protein QVD17_41572 [Tagetes erecta]|uniref:HAT C-terminal dimerisation domain-containing protein n=1 Tax=Tagetes erecta TaxID=13708 RepID=A0AAD8JKQ7_TARER|nr:hypothetical protein QVD17_41572 [Tagetes erecta]